MGAQGSILLLPSLHVLAAMALQRALPQQRARTRRSVKKKSIVGRREIAGKKSVRKVSISAVRREVAKTIIKRRGTYRWEEDLWKRRLQTVAGTDEAGRGPL